VTLANPQGYVPDPQWTNFLKDWALLLDSGTEEEYTSRLTKFRIHKDAAVKYIEDTWLKWKEKLVKYWVDQYLHFGVRVTSPIEGCHAVLKAYLRVSTSDLKGVFDRLLHYWPTQHRAICDTAAQEQNRVNHHLNKRYLDLVQGLVHDRALHLIRQEKAKLHKAEDEATLTWPCSCTVQASLGIPCYHYLFERLKDGGRVLPKDIHPFWWYDRSKASAVLEKRDTGTPLILEPAIFKRKGRPKGSKGNGPRAKKGEGVTSMFTILRKPNIIVLF
jgi:hypothetical protein